MVLSDFAEEEESPPATETDVAEDGSFEVDVSTGGDVEQNPDSSAAYVMLAWDPTLGVGVDQSLGFIELPAGADESTAGRLAAPRRARRWTWAISHRAVTPTSRTVTRTSSTMS